MKKPVGILGGSFDPVHFGHLRLALECMQLVDLEKVIFVPLASPPHRSPLWASAEQRIRMLELAIMDVGGLLVSDIEVKRQGTTYTIDTLKEFRDSLGNQPICLILGMDAFQEFDSWKEWDSIPEYAHLIIADRHNAKQVLRKDTLQSFYESIQVTDKEGIHNSTNGKALRLAVPMLDISSSRIRELLHDKHSAKFLLPDNVLDFINLEGIY